MLYQDLLDVPVEVFGGYTPAIPPQDLPPGASPFCQDVIFPKGSVRSRGGLRNLGFGLIPVNAKVNGLQTYITPTLNQRLMVWDSKGTLYKEAPQGTLNIAGSRPYTDLLFQAVTLFGRQYQSFFNITGAADIPRQFDDTNWDRVSHDGPGAAPVVGDDTTTVVIDAAAGSASQLALANILSIVLNGNVVTVVTNNPFGVGLPGEMIFISGVPVVGYNGTFPVNTVISPVSFTYVLNSIGGLAPSLGGTVISQIAIFKTDSPSDPIGLTPTVPTQITVSGVSIGGYNGTWTQIGISSWGVPKKQVIYANIGQIGLANGAGGQIIYPGNITAGLRECSVSFINRQGYITKPAVAPSFWTAAGGKRAQVTKIPTGPSNIVARLIIFTQVITPPATTGAFFSLPNGVPQIASSSMLINDNTTTSAVIDFSDAILAGGFQATYLFSQITLGETSRMDGYNSRLVAIGERNRLQNMVNLGFDGGFSGGIPLGWTQDAMNGGGVSAAVAGGFTADWGEALAITGDGVTPLLGKLYQTAFQDYLNVAIIANNTGYGVRVRVASANGLAQGNLHINLSSKSGGFTTAGITVTAAQVGPTYKEFIANLTDAPLSNPPKDLVLQIYADGTPTGAGVFLVDSIEPFPLSAPFNYSTARFSHAFNPESFDATLGQVQVNPNDGQQLRTTFPLRSNLYLEKDHYYCYVTDDGVNEPAGWGVNEVSKTVGACGPNAVDWIEEWAVSAERSGAYIFWGGDPIKITQEVEEDASLTGKVSWSSINWTYGFTIWIRIDQTNRRILIGAPVNGATQPNVIFVLDFKWLDSGQDIAASPMVTYSAFTGKILAHGRGRRWAPWNISANSMCLAERQDGTAQPFFGNNAGNGKVYQQIDAPNQLSDDGVAFTARYDTYFVPDANAEQGLQLGAHRKLLGYMKWRAIGGGFLNIAIQTANRVTNIRAYTLTLQPKGDGERPLQINGERFSFQFSTSTTTSWFQLEKVIPCMRKSGTIVVRGVSA